MADHTPSTLKLAETYMFLEDGGAAHRIRVTDAFWKDLMSGTPRSPEASLVAAGSGWLSAVYPITADTRSWEMHPEGDELLAMLSGVMGVVLEFPERELIVELGQGVSFVVPKGIWHRQLLRSPGEYLAATYGKGTKHRPLQEARNERLAT